jgi:hypothetical protein
MMGRTHTLGVCCEADGRIVGDYGIKDRTDRVCKVVVLSKTGRWAKQLELLTRSSVAIRQSV